MLPALAAVSLGLFPVVSHRPAVAVRCCVRSAADEPGGSLAVLGGALATVAERSGPPTGWRQMGPSWVRLPSKATPWATVHFVGGAALGIAPQLCYDGLLTTVAETAGVTVIATPYDVGLDHARLARQVAADFAATVEQCRAEGLVPPEGSPLFRIGHSLGAKLLVLLGCGSDEAGGKPDPCALLAFNNFKIADSVALASAYVSEMQGGRGGSPYASAVTDAFAFVQQLSTAQGIDIEVSPTPEELAAAVASSYAPASTAIFRFEDDTLDSSEGLLEALPASTTLTEETLRGSHTAPVSLTLAVDDINPALSMLVGGSRSISIGDKELVKELAERIVGWLWPAGMAPPNGKRALAQGPAIDIG